MYFVNFRWIKWRAAAYASFMRVQVIFQYAHMKRALFNRFAVFVVVVVVYFDFGHLALSQHIQKQIFHNCFFGVFCVVRSIHLLAKRFFFKFMMRDSKHTNNTRINSIFCSRHQREMNIFNSKNLPITSWQQTNRIALYMFHSVSLSLRELSEFIRKLIIGVRQCALTHSFAFVSKI